MNETPDAGAPVETVALTLAEAEALSLRALTRAGADDANARAVTAVMIAAERDICASHGLFRLEGYVQGLTNGRVNGRAAPKVERLAPGVVAVNGDRGYAPLAFETGRSALIEAAKTQGIAALAIRDTHHFAALWPEVEALMAADLCGFAFTAATPMVAPAGGARPFFGTNPMGFGFPRDPEAGPPPVFDQASAAMARGDVQIHARDGRPVPEGVGVGPDGLPTTDPNAVLAGAQLPFGGYKGSSLALMVELLVGALIGQPFSYESDAAARGGPGAPFGGELVLALDPARFGDAGGWRTRAEAFYAALLAQEGVRLPGARRHANRAKTAQSGIALPKSLYDTVVALAGPKG
ncbi:MAG: Ldh family oxidoreductase [Pseudomonadota bacterium]